MTDRDEALHYLLNKLKSEDGWSSSNLTWNDEKLAVISDQFSSFDGVVKAKVLLSFLSMSPRTISKCSVEMQQILRLARRDGDEWVRLFATILAPFPHSQTTDVEPCTEGNMEGVQTEVAEACEEEMTRYVCARGVSQKTDSTFIPHEFACLNHSVLAAAHNYAPPTSHTHFTLRQQPQASVQLRNEILQKAEMDFAQTGSLVKDRHLLQRQMSATGSNPFVSTSRSSSSRKSVPIPGHSTSRIQRERGTKLLDINEVPMTFKRKRRVAADLELPSGGEMKRNRSMSKSEPDTPTPTLPVATPDYAAGLGVEYPPATPSSSRGPGGSEISGVVGATGKKGALELALQSPVSTSVATETQKTPAATPSVPFYSLTSPTYQPYPRATTTPTGPIPPHITPHTPNTPSTPTLPTSPTTPITPAPKQPSKGLRINRQQLMVAHEMFKESPNLTREQKSLILGFMAGARENPHPGQDVVTVKLNDRVQWEGVGGGGGEGGKGEGRNMLIETVFEMNYATGLWRKLQFKRPAQHK